MVTSKSVKLSEETKERLDTEKLYARETYDDVINRILDNLEELTKVNKK